MRWYTRAAGRRLILGALVMGALAIALWSVMVRMPGESHQGALPALNDHERALSASMRADLEHLAGDIGERNMSDPLKLEQTAQWLEGELALSGYSPNRQTYEIRHVPCSNIEVSIPGSSRVVIVGAHYDSAIGAPGANDNGSGVVGLLALARRFAKTAHGKTLRFVFFVNEEPPWFWTSDMGSAVYARKAHEHKDDITAMISLETIGHYSNEEGSQKYPFPLIGAFYPDKANFIAFVGNTDSRELVRQAIGEFRRTTPFPSEGAALPDKTAGVGWSDHEPFWNQGVPAMMVTDTALFRYPQYHTKDDTPDRVDYDDMARVVVGLESMIDLLVRD